MRPVLERVVACPTCHAPRLLPCMALDPPLHRLDKPVATHLARRTAERVYWRERLVFRD